MLWCIPSAPAARDPHDDDEDIPPIYTLNYIHMLRACLAGSSWRAPWEPLAECPSSFPASRSCANHMCVVFVTMRLRISVCDHNQCIRTHSTTDPQLKKNRPHDEQQETQETQ